MFPKKPAKKQEIVTRRPSAVTQLSLNIKVIKKKSGSHLKPVNTLPLINTGSCILKEWLPGNTFDELLKKKIVHYSSRKVVFKSTVLWQKAQYFT